MATYQEYRAATLRPVLAAYAETVGIKPLTDDELRGGLVSQLLTDLRHFVELNDIDFYEALRLSYNFYLDERADTSFLRRDGTFFRGRVYDSM